MYKCYKCDSELLLMESNWTHSNYECINRIKAGSYDEPHHTLTVKYYDEEVTVTDEKFYISSSNHNIIMMYNNYIQKVSLIKFSEKDLLWLPLLPIDKLLRIIKLKAFI